MSGQDLSKVRNELDSRSTQTTISELRKRGMRQVRVIRSSAILELLQEAVDRAMAQHGLVDPGEQSALVSTSQEIFRGMMHGDEEPAARRAEARDLAGQYKKQVEDGQAELELVREQLAGRDRELQESQAQSAELNAELQLLQKRAGSAATPESLFEELRALRGELKAGAGVSAPSEQQVESVVADAVKSQLESLGDQLSGQMEKIGRKVGLQQVEDVESDLSSLFNSDDMDEIESNIESLEAKESKGSDVEDALARMRQLKSDS